MTETTTLYRMYDELDELLYVGITRTLLTRMKQHSGDKPWFAEVTRARYEHFDTRQLALDAEKNAIIVEKPRYNVIHNHGRTVAASRTDQDPNGRWLWSARGSGYQRRTDLFLEPEIDCSSMVMESDLDGEGQLYEWIDYLKRRHPDELDAVPIYWSVTMPHGAGMGYAPFQDPNEPGMIENGFLQDQTWPIDARTGELLDWFKLPIRWRPGCREFAAALDWIPSRMQPTCPLRAIMASRGVSL